MFLVRSLRDMNCLPFWIIKPVHSINARQHGEPPGTDEGEAECDEDADPESDGDHVPALPLGAESPSTHLEDLHPPLREVKSYTNRAAVIHGPELAGGGTGVREANWSIDGVTLHRPPAEVQLVVLHLVQQAGDPQAGHPPLGAFSLKVDVEVDSRKSPSPLPHEVGVFKVEVEPEVVLLLLGLQVVADPAAGDASLRLLVQHEGVELSSLTVQSQSDAYKKKKYSKYIKNQKVISIIIDIDIQMAQQEITTSSKPSLSWSYSGL